MISGLSKMDTKPIEIDRTVDFSESKQVTICQTLTGSATQQRHRRCYHCWICAVSREEMTTLNR